MKRAPGRARSGQQQAMAVGDLHSGLPGVGRPPPGAWDAVVLGDQLPRIVEGVHENLIAPVYPALGLPGEDQCEGIASGRLGVHRAPVRLIPCSKRSSRAAPVHQSPGAT